MHYHVSNRNAEMDAAIKWRKAGVAPFLGVLMSVWAFLLLSVVFSANLFAAERYLKVCSFAVKDPHMGGLPAFKVLAPANWQLKGGLNWDTRLANLVTVDVAITAPDGTAGFYVHPAPMFVSGQIQYQWPQGQLYLGMYVVPMPDSPVEYLEQHVLPRQRPDASNLRLIRQKDLPDWANGIARANVQPGNTPRGYGTCARFAYSQNGRRWEEDFYCVVLVSGISGAPNLFWLADRNLSVRAPAGKLDALQPLANAFVNSFRVERQWYGRFVQVQQQWIAAQQQGIANAGALSRAISRSNDRFNEAMTASWRRRQQAEDRASREFSEYIRGTEHYQDPVNDTRVELPGGYDHAWANALGEYILSNDAGFNPNLDSNVSWTAISR